MRYRDKLIRHSVEKWNPLIDNTMPKWLIANAGMKKTTMNIDVFLSI